MIRPDLDEVKTLSSDYRTVPIARELLADRRTPMEILRVLKNISRHCYILESMEETDRWGRYTFLGYDPKLEITCLNGALHIRNGTDIRLETRDPARMIRQILADNRSPRLAGFPPFTGGLVGYFSYDFIKYGEPSLHLDASDEEGFKDIDLMLFDRVIVFDHLKQKIILIVNMKTEAPEQNYNRALLELDHMAELVTKGEACRPEPLHLQSGFRALFGKDEFCRMVERAKTYIHEGDIFQVVLSNRLEAEAEGGLLDAYRLLRATNPSPYMFYFSSDDIEIAGASPETLVKLQDGTLYTLPLAGTKPRGKTEEEDAALEAALLSDEKELAEHNMLVDLGQNDLGRISEFGSVTVEEYLGIKRFSHVMHIGSAVRGTIRQDKDALDAIKAVLPAGTLSGAPKIRACEIINELENNKRGVYGGAIGLP